MHAMECGYSKRQSEKRKKTVVLVPSKLSLSKENGDLTAHRLLWDPSLEVAIVEQLQLGGSNLKEILGLGLVWA
ncbi:hypothetical protein H5410_016749 [Solanum commersonii]|uniref:Uncharacterized protein n=1 Tax=Solanum commersonii TaxID=4109 RepID=A0A9J5ZX44_SOLCO|nr:hypothetical protein H5410_016749 [Solanum commersonii]